MTFGLAMAGIYQQKFAWHPPIDIFRNMQRTSNKWRTLLLGRDVIATRKCTFRIVDYRVV